MNTLERRLSKIEKNMEDKKHPGVFLIFSDNGILTIANDEEKNKSFADMKDLEEYIYHKYISDKYVFINFDISRIKKD